MEKVLLIRSSSDGANKPAISIVQKTFTTFSNCSSEKVNKMILKSPSKSCSCDPIPATLLKDNIQELLPFLTLICNISLSTGVLPVSQKRAIITPILKKPGTDPSVAANYRLISNLSFISKVIERTVAFQLTAYLDNNDFWPLTQSTYRYGHSTDTTLIRIISDIFEAYDTSKVTLIALLDLSAAFDCMDQVILLECLRITYGIDGLSLT